VLDELSALSGRVLVCVEANEPVHDTIGRFQDSFQAVEMLQSFEKRTVPPLLASCRLNLSLKIDSIKVALI
jgi:hypothetical protein